MSRLERYLGEREEQSALEERELQIEENPVVEDLLDAFGIWLDELKPYQLHENYENARHYISHKEYTASDVMQFSLGMIEYQEHEHFEAKASLFLSQLVNSGDEDAYVIITEHIEKDLLFLGYLNTRDITIIGSGGYFLAQNMRGGTIRVQGDVHVDLIRVGEGMESGRIYHNGKLIRSKEDVR